MTSTTGHTSEFARGEPPAARGRKGFTLLELILVMLIAAVAMTIAMPSLGRFSSGRNLRDQAERILALAAYARDQAMAEGRPYRLEIDTGEGTFRLTAAGEDGTFDFLGREQGREFRLPDTLAVEWVEPPRTVPGRREGPFPPAVPEIREDNEGILFHPDGRTEPCVLRLGDRRGNSVDIVCDAPALGFRLADREADR